MAAAAPGDDHTEPQAGEVLRDGSVRTGLGRLFAWLTAHGEIRVVCATFLDDSNAELSLPRGQVPALIAAANTADALTDVAINVTDRPIREAAPAIGTASISVVGTADSAGGPIDVIAMTTVHGTARALLLGMLDEPATPQERAWFVQSDLLREVADQVAATTSRRGA